MKQLVLLSFFLFSFFDTPQANAAFSPVSISLFPPLQFPPQDFSVTGVRLGLIVGKQRNMYGLDFGLLGNITDLDFAGLALAGGFNYTAGTTLVFGLQMAGLANINANKTTVYGLQAALGANINRAASKFVGIQFSTANVSSFSDIYGFQIGVFNRALNVYGIQIGLVNFTKNLHGLQIGLLNFNETGTFFVSPLLNVGF